MAQFHMSWKELVWGIDWPILQRMIIDGPVYDNKPDEGDSDEADERLRQHANNIKNGY